MKMCYLKFKKKLTYHLLSVNRAFLFVSFRFDNVLYLPLNLVHTSDISISTRSIRKQSIIYPLRLVNTKQREFFFIPSFVLLLAYASTMFLGPFSTSTVPYRNVAYSFVFRTKENATFRYGTVGVENGLYACAYVALHMSQA